MLTNYLFQIIEEGASLSEQEFLTYCDQLKKNPLLYNIYIGLDCCNLIDPLKTNRLSLILLALAEHKDFNSLTIYNDISYYKTVDASNYLIIESAIKFLLPFVDKFNYLKTFSLCNCFLGSCSKETILEFFNVLLKKDSLNYFSLNNNGFINLDPEFLLKIVELSFTKKPELFISFWEYYEGLDKLKILIEQSDFEKISKLAKIDLLTSLIHIFTLSSSEEYKDYLLDCLTKPWISPLKVYDIVKFLTINNNEQKKITLDDASIVLEQIISKFEIKEAFWINSIFIEKFNLSSNRRINLIKLMFEKALYLHNLNLPDNLFDDIAQGLEQAIPNVPYTHNLYYLVSFLEDSRLSQVWRNKLIQSLLENGIEIPIKKILDLFTIQAEHKWLLTIQNFMTLISIFQRQRELLESENANLAYNTKLIINTMSKYINQIESIPKNVKIIILLLLQKYYGFTSYGYNTYDNSGRIISCTSLRFDLEQKLFLEPKLTRMKLGLSLLPIFCTSDKSLLPIITSVVVRVLDNPNPETIPFFLACLKKSQESCIVPHHLHIDFKFSKDDLQLMLSLSIANKNAAIANYILNRLRTVYNAYLPKKSNDDIVVSVLVFPYEVSTIITAENSTENFLKELRKYLPPNKSKLQVIVYSKKMPSTLVVENPYITRHATIHKDYCIVDPIEIYFNQEIFKAISNSDIIFVTPIEAIEFSLKEYGLPIITIECTSFNPFFGAIIPNVRKLHNYKHANLKQLKKLNLTDLIKLNMFATINDDFLFVSQKIKPLLLSKLPSCYPNPNCLVFLTDAPYGSLGDISAASKAISCLQRTPKYNNYKITWIVREPNGHIKIPDLIPENVELIYVRHWKEIRFNIRVIALLLQQSLIFSYPTFHYLSDTDKQFLTAYGASLLSITEYDYHYKDFTQIESYSLHQNEHFLETGLNPKAIGVFVKNLKAIKKEEVFNDLWLNQNIIKDHHLFFGYFAPHNDVSLYNYTTPKIFALMCIKKILKQPIIFNGCCYIDIVCNFNMEDLAKIKHEISNLPISSLSFLNKKNNDLYKEDFLKLNQQVLNKIEVRLLNPFPLSHHDMQLLLAISDPLVALTGDSSLTEGIERHKIILYQIMEWKYTWFESFLQYTKNVLLAQDNAAYQLEFKNCKTQTEVYAVSNECSVFEPKKLFLTYNQETGDWSCYGYNDKKILLTTSLSLHGNNEKNILKILESHKELLMSSKKISINIKLKIIQAIRIKLGLIPKLCRFLELQMLSSVADRDQQLLQLICQDEDILISEIKKVHYHMVQYNSLYDNFARAVTAIAYHEGIWGAPLYKQLSPKILVERQSLLPLFSIRLASDIQQGYYFATLYNPRDDNHKNDTQQSNPKKAICYKTI